MRPESFSYQRHHEHIDPLETLGDQHGHTGNEDTSLVPPKRERWDPEEATRVYQERLRDLKAKQQDLEETLNMLEEDASIASRFSTTQIQELVHSLEKVKDEILLASANYPGDWTLLLYDRMRDPISKEKFMTQRTKALQGLNSETPPANFVGNRNEIAYQSHYRSQMAKYDERLDYIFSATEFVKAEEYNRLPRHLGRNAFSGQGTVFSDGIHNGIPLTSRQMNIVEAHEKGHGFRDFVSHIDREELQAVIDKEALLALTNEYRTLEKMGQKEGTFEGRYVEHPAEIIERMAQFKNYFGMGASDTFTKKHLDYIREHYLADIGLDNGVSDLLRCITPKTEAAFLAIINTYPI